MLDIKLIRENPEMVRKNLEKRGDPDLQKQLNDLIRSDAEWRQLLTQVNELRHKRRIVTEEVAKLKKEGEDAAQKLREAKSIPEQIEKLEKEVENRREKVNNLLYRLPNLLHDSVPFGKNEGANEIVRLVGKPLEFDFPPKNHMEIAQNLDLVDAERAAKIAGHGFYYLKGALALLDLAILRYAVDFLVKRGYQLVEPPSMLRKRAYLGATDLEFFEEQLYKIEGEELYMIATAEHPLAAYFMDDVIEQSALPVKLVGFSTNFRKEVGAHGKYTKGLFRMHQFNKVEQFIFCLPQDSWILHEELQKNAEDLYAGLGLHFRTTNVCTGDIGNLAAKKYDIEVWMADGVYREIGSNSNCTDYQARRLNIRYREKKGMAPAGFVHTLNNTALATSRTMMAILEQYQQKDDSVVIPKALRPYMNETEKITKA
ncbi:MAG TPA: serine--tRNA ligase [Candidatus Bathyarchaeia archaeon]|nr:serine--tRNA ligase [Candidatus Bathyarchaeia archaeon]